MRVLTETTYGRAQTCLRLNTIDKGIFMRPFVIAVSALALLSGCSGGNADTDGDGKISTAEADAEAAKAGLSPGMWEKSVKLVEVDLDLGDQASPEEKAQADTEIESMIGRERSEQICLSEQDAKNPKASFFAPGSEGGCEYTEFSVSGGKLKTEMKCEADEVTEKMKVVMSGDYTDSSFSGDYVLNVDAAEKGSLEMKGRSTMKRIGDCPG